MLDGLLLFSVLDVWRVLLPLGLSIICLGTLAFQRMVGGALDSGLSQFLCIVSYRLTATLAVIMAVVGIVVPWILGYTLPEAHLADGPWSYEEMCGYLLGLLCLWRLQQQVRQQQNPSGLMMTCAMILFLWAGLIWIGRWDAMANVGHVPGGWFLGSLAQWEWFRIIPKIFHLLFSAMVTGGMVVAGLGIFGTLTPESQPGPNDSDSRKSSPDIIRYGMGWILSGLVPQMLIGPWLFLLLHPESQTVLFDGTSLTSLLFFVSLTTALLAMVSFNASFMAPYVKGFLWSGLVNVLVTLILMGIVRYETFVSTLFSQRIPIAIAELSGWHVLSVFVLTGLLGVILVRWCVWPLALIFSKILPTSKLGAD
jgi:hypothetical protein